MRHLFAGVVVMVVGACTSKMDLGAPDASLDTTPNADVRDTGCGKCAMDVVNPQMCPTPFDVSSYMPEQLPDPLGKHLGKCTPMQLDQYHKCVNDSDMAACMAIQQLAMTTFKDCLACLETTVMDAKWGPLVCANSMDCYLNVEGCVNLATSQTGMTSCGQLLHASYGCQRAACETQCSGDAVGFSKCVQTALAGGCKKYGDAFSQKCGTISSDPDGGYPDLDNCFRRQTEMDSKLLRVRMDTYFCGP